MIRYIDDFLGVSSIFRATWKRPSKKTKEETLKNEEVQVYFADWEKKQGHYVIPVKWRTLLSQLEDRYFQ